MADAPLYDPELEQWPDLQRGRVALSPVRVGMDRRTGKMLVGWNHVLQSIEVIFATRFHERVLRRWVGSFIPHMLGESIMEKTLTNFYWAIASALDLWEPCYSLQRIYLARRADMSTLTTIDDIRAGAVTTQNMGIYRPRGHLGDPTPEQRRIIGLVSRGSGLWEAK